MEEMSLRSKEPSISRPYDEDEDSVGGGGAPIGKHYIEEANQEG